MKGKVHFTLPFELVNGCISEPSLYASYCVFNEFIKGVILGDLMDLFACRHLRRHAGSKRSWW